MMPGTKSGKLPGRETIRAFFVFSLVVWETAMPGPGRITAAGRGKIPLNRPHFLARGKREREFQSPRCCRRIHGDILMEFRHFLHQGLTVPNATTALADNLMNFLWFMHSTLGLKAFLFAMLSPPTHVRFAPKFTLGFGNLKNINKIRPDRWRRKPRSNWPSRVFHTSPEKSARAGNCRATAPPPKRTSHHHECG